MKSAMERRQIAFLDGSPGGRTVRQERLAAEPQTEREGVKGEERRVADTAGLGSECE